MYNNGWKKPKVSKIYVFWNKKIDIKRVYEKDIITASRFNIFC